MKNILDKNKLIVSKRQPKNLKRYLTQARFDSENKEPSVTKCGEKRCGTCEVLITGNSITFKNEKSWKVNSQMNCKAKHIIYVIICSKCKSFYVGQTEDLRKRVTLHKEQIRHKEYRHLKVSEHMDSCNKGNFEIMPIYQCMNTNRLFRETKEKELISILKPDLNSN